MQLEPPISFVQTDTMGYIRRLNYNYPNRRTIGADHHASCLFWAVKDARNISRLDRFVYFNFSISTEAATSPVNPS